MSQHTSTQAAPPLWRQLQLTAGVVQAVSQGVSGTAAVDAVPLALRPGVQALSFEVWRAWGRASAVRKLLAPRAPPAAVDALLCTSLALLWQPQAAIYDAFTLVNQAVEAAKKTPAVKAQANFINACLRRFLRERKALLSQVEGDEVARWNHPAWWIKRLQADWPLDWQAILQANNQHAPMTLRVNTRRTSRAHYLDLLRSVGQSACPVAESGLQLMQSVAVHKLPGFADGLCSVQDAAAQLAAPLLLGLPTQAVGFRVLDACAAPGGKTAHLLEWADVRVTALDMDASRCERIHQTLQRQGLTARVLANDATEVAAWWDGVPFDAILLDAPCSASGIVRRHPDIRWLRRDTDIAQLAAIQARLLDALWPLLKPGGRLLYATCSIFKAEGSDQVDAFLARNTQVRIAPSPGHLLPGRKTADASSIDNLLGDHDGFFYALLEKTAA
ncbi:MAG: 16S rRNA (cytosine(967)-C(5))-methyltransferase RsmB [Rhodoferax sp.]|jgi:16S rRNA (cytosine967-C5)-methyltransferase|nr:16S rRNA (cytosine(967)-C(5))-methyltransferase RsmB [Rhodoferax sp.]